MKSKDEILIVKCEKYETFLHLEKNNEIIDGSALSAFEAMDEYAKQESIEFFKWNAVKVWGYLDYIQKVRNAVTSKEIEERLNEFEGATIGERYELYLKDKENQLTIG